MIFQSGEFTILIQVKLTFALTKLRPSTQNFESFTMQGVTPSAGNLEQLVEDTFTMVLSKVNDFWKYRTVKQKLTVEGVRRVCIGE